MHDSPHPARPRVLSGMRPTGRLHLGNYMGALYNWVELQNRVTEAGKPEYDCFFFIADWHALTTGYADPSEIAKDTREIALDFLAAGLDPARTVLFKQSEVPAHAVLNTLLGMFTPLSWLERVPTYRDQQEQLRERDLATYGFLGYPLLQAADILLYQPEFVPVGADQVAHVELTREVARRFNALYPGGFRLAADAKPWEMEAIRTRARKMLGDKTLEVFTPHQLLAAAQETKKLSPYRIVPVLPEPQVLLTPSPKLPGLDGRKMSKSYGNTLAMAEPPESLRTKLKVMVTDPARVHRSDPGNPDVCPVFDLHRVFSPEPVQVEAAAGCRSAAIGCIECKSWVANAIVERMEPIRQRRAELETQPELVGAVLQDGAARAGARAAVTMGEVYRVMGLG